MPDNNQQQPATKADLESAIDRVLQTVAAEFPATREEFRAELDRRLNPIDRRLERIETHVNAIQMNIVAMSKSLSDAERLDSSMLATQAAQQRAIDDLARRVARLEDQIGRRS